MDRRHFLKVGGATVGAPFFAQRLASAPQEAGDQRTVEGIQLCWCPAGRFVMGSPVSEPGHRPDEAQTEVTLSRGFWAAKFEVTQGEWQRFSGEPPERPLTDQFGRGGDVPVYWVSYRAAERFCAQLTQAASRSGSLPSGWAFRLPTEAQWEYACRAGTTTATAFGDALTVDRANYGKNVGRSVSAGRYPANAWNIHDMHGNVWEWCRDWYHAQLPGGVDPDLSDVPGVPNRDGSHSRVRRGGAWIEAGEFCRSATRLRYEPERVSDHIGLRVVLAPS